MPSPTNKYIDFLNTGTMDSQKIKIESSEDNESHQLNRLRQGKVGLNIDPGQNPFSNMPIGNTDKMDSSIGSGKNFGSSLQFLGEQARSRGALTTK